MCNAHNHPAGCTCGWGGDGHAGTTYGWQDPPQPITFPAIRVWREPDFTWPTHCPECGEDVYFIRHNGGSVWIDPPLGWPWPKHACFDKPTEPTYTFSSWTAKSSGLTNPKLGIIVRISSEPQIAEPRIEIRLPNNSLVTLVLRFTPPDSVLLGALVIFSKEDNMLLHQVHAEIPFHSFNEKPRMARGWYECPRCKATVKEGTGHENHCRANFGKRKLPGGVELMRPKMPTVQTKANIPLPNPTLSHRKKSILVYSAKPKNRTARPPLAQQAPTAIPKKDSLEERIRDAVGLIAAKAWEAARGIEPPEEQLRQAKHKALELISMLSPSIKRQVGHAFTAEHWVPLIKRRPARF